MSIDWLEVTDERVLALPIDAPLPPDFRSKLQLVESCMSRLSDSQRAFLTAYRAENCNARAASRASGMARTSHIRWMHEPDYATIVRVWNSVSADAALDRDRLLARQDDIVETLLTPKPMLHQGIMIPDTRIGARPGTVLEEVEAGAASRANEVLMKAAGLLKDKELDINIGIQVGPPTLNIQVMPLPPSQTKVLENVVIDAKFIEAPAQIASDAGYLPGPDDGSWLE